VGTRHVENVRHIALFGQGVNAYAVAVDQMDEAARLLESRFTVERFPHSLNIAAAGSNLRVQLQTDPRYFPFVDRAARREVLGIELPVASVEDVLQGKIWAASDDTRRPTKRRKDLLDIERILENCPHLRERVPPALSTLLLHTLS
jgi:hypothetical protein